MKITAERLRELLNYDPETGLFSRRLIKPKSPKDVGCNSGYGYFVIRVDGVLHGAHRLAWLYMTGEWPKNEIDHRDGDKSNNRFANLRDVKDLVNQQNIRKPKANNKTGFLGVFAINGRYRASLTVNRESVYLGTYDEPELAHAAYVEAKRIHHEGCTI